MNNQNKTSEDLTPNLPLWSYQLQQDSKLAVKTRKDLEIHLITRALKDEAFRQELIANPKAVVEKELGAKLPEKLEINVLKETEDTLYMVLPCNPYNGLSDEELKASLGMTYEDIARWVLEQQRNDFLDEEKSINIIARAWRDEAFQQKLIHDPVQVIEQELGAKIQEHIKIEIFAETANTLYIVLTSINDSFQAPDLGTEILSQFNMLMVIANSLPATFDGPQCTYAPFACLTVNKPDSCKK
jgi:Nitrile hydratase, alpha chain